MIFKDLGDFITWLTFLLELFTQKSGDLGCVISISLYS